MSGTMNVKSLRLLLKSKGKLIKKFTFFLVASSMVMVYFIFLIILIQLEALLIAYAC
jgi:flagellar biosynthesis component FlhA